MPRFGNNSTTNSAAHNADNRNGQVKFHWSFSYEVDLPSSASMEASAGAPARNRFYSDNLSAVLDRALAFAG
jgi:hypothetical protein